MEIISPTFLIEDYNIFKNKMLNWANRFSIFCFLDNNGYNFNASSFDCILATGCKKSIEPEPGKAFSELQKFYNENPCWLFGHLGYDLKNEVEALHSKNKPLIDFGLSFFFEPESIVQIKDGKFTVISSLQSAAGIYAEINNQSGEIINTVTTNVNVKNSISKNEYVDTILKLQNHIRRGDCYEINFCQQFFAQNAIIDPLFIYSNLIRISANPFSVLYKLKDKYCLCASPERYLKKSGRTIISQPIKGTGKRDLNDSVADELNKNKLHNSAKEKAENVMVVDLVRNDLNKICTEGSVQVQELFGIYSFPQVHQMISTVTGILQNDIDWTGAIKASFPMGSMTGAPKKRVMQLIEEYEVGGRGLFSGSIGYITPVGDFDFNVVIRSIFYDGAKKSISFLAGGGITFYSNAEDEYEECMLKAAAIINVLKA
ncbi:MAG: anthranilate synthase component I family protein [Ferruginibacter sp.]